MAIFIGFIIGHTFNISKSKGVILMCKLEIRIIVKSSELKRNRIKGLDCLLNTISSYGLPSENGNPFPPLWFREDGEMIKAWRTGCTEEVRKVGYLAQRRPGSLGGVDQRFSSTRKNGSAQVGELVTQGETSWLWGPPGQDGVTAERLAHVAFEKKWLASCLLGKIVMPSILHLGLPGMVFLLPLLSQQVRNRHACVLVQVRLF